MKRPDARTIAFGALATAVSVGGIVAASRSTLAAWARNPDPLNGVPVSFDGVETVVETDDGARISTRTAGSGPVVVLVHGLTGNHDEWGPVASRLLARNRRVVTVDQRGHGDSSVGQEGYGAPRLGKDLARVLEVLDLRHVTLAGHSMGGMAVLSMAVDRPDVVRDRVAHLVLIATSASSGALRTQAGMWLGSLSLFDSARWIDDRLQLGAGLIAFGKNPSLFMVEESVRSFTKCPNDVRHAATAALRSYDVTDRLRTIDVRTTVIAGTHDMLTPLAGNQVVADEIRGATIEVIDDAGHLIIWEHADRVADILESDA